MSLFLKLQKRVTELEQEKQSLQDELHRKEEHALRAKAKLDSFLLTKCWLQNIPGEISAMQMLTGFYYVLIFP